MGGHLSGGLMIGARSGIRRPGAPAVPPTPPFPVAGLTGRARADSVGGANGSAVALWPGLVGGDATQGTAARRPTLVSVAINGKPAVNFDRAQTQYLAWTVSAVIQTFTVAAVFKTGAGFSGFNYILGPSTFGGLAFLIHANGDTRLENDGDTAILGYSPSAYASSTVYSLMMSFSSANAALAYGYRNGVSIGSGGGVTGHPLSGGATHLIGHNLGSFTTAPFNGQIAEVSKWDHALDAAERAAFFAYTLDRYGV